MADKQVSQQTSQQIAEPVNGQSSGALFQASQNLDLYDSPSLEKLATQAGTGRYLYLSPQTPDPQTPSALAVWTVEDDYPGWLNPQDLSLLRPAPIPYDPPQPDPVTIADRRANVIEFCFQAMAQPNVYLWGGTVGPNYDCSGLMQHGFATWGIWLPRDAYQQEAFCTPIINSGTQPEAILPRLVPGDLLFFGSPEKTTHVGLYLGEGNYLHSSGSQQGRNGIGIDCLSESASHPVSQKYYSQFRGAGRVTHSYQPAGSYQLMDQLKG